MFRRLPLGSLLGALNAGLLLLAVTALAWGAITLLGRLVDEQAAGRVRQANTSAQIVIGRVLRDTALDARLLGDRPTLRRLLDADDRAGLASFLARFRASSQLDGLAVLHDGALVISNGLALDGLPLAAGETLLPAPDGDGLLAVAVAPISERPESSVLVLRRLGAAFGRAMSDEIGLPAAVYLHNAATGAMPDLHAEAVASGAIQSRRLGEPDRYVAAAALAGPDGRPVGVVEVTLPAESVSAPVAAFTQTLALLAGVLTVAAALLNILAGRFLSRPLARLTHAAARIGGGDLGRPIPGGLSAEINTLATTLEEMRRRLLALTVDLRRKQAEQQAVLSGIVEGVFSVDRDRRVGYINPQAAALLGISPEEAAGRFCGDLLNPRPVDGVRPCEERCPIIHARFRQGARATEHLVGADGRVRTVVITSAPLIDDMQVQVLRDETEIETSRRMRDSILANISHEFRTPLSAQLASIELLLDQLPDLPLEQVGRLVRSLQRSTLRLNQLVDNLLESARVEAGQTALRRTPVALDAVVEDALELTRPLLEQRGQRVSVELPYPLPPLVGDAPRLTQVFVNLLANAHKYAPTASMISLGGELEADLVRLWVEDEGPGSALLRDGAGFERFVRAAGDEPEQSGMGLGLWICKSIVARHGGEIAARSDSGGTRVTVSLPLEHPDEDPDR